MEKAEITVVSKEVIKSIKAMIKSLQKAYDFKLAARTIAAIYNAHWEVELFFKYKIKN